MSALVFPPSLTPAKIEWSLDRGGVVNPSMLSGAVQRTDFGFQTWRASVQMPTLTGEDAAIFQAFMDEACRFDRHFYFHNPAQELRGSFDNSELLTNGDFTNGSTGWTGLSAVVREGSRLLRVANSAASRGRAIQDVTLTSGNAYCVIADAEPSTASAGQVVVFDETASATVVNESESLPGRIIGSFSAANTGTYQIELSVGTTVSGESVCYSYASLMQCLLVNGGSQSGGELLVDHAPAFENGTIRRGDLFTVMVGGVPSMHRLIADVDAGSTGAATLRFEPALPGSPADNAPIILRNPFCRMYIPEHSTSSMHTPPMLLGSAFDCVEDPTR